MEHLFEEINERFVFFFFFVEKKIIYEKVFGSTLMGCYN